MMESFYEYNIIISAQLDFDLVLAAYSLVGCHRGICTEFPEAALNLLKISSYQLDAACKLPTA